MSKNYKIIFIILGGMILTLGIGFSVVYYFFLSAPQSEKTEDVLVVRENQPEGEIIDELASRGFFRNKKAFLWIFENKKEDGRKIEPGGYNISKNMNTQELAEKLLSDPDMKWVVILPGYRKEQIGEILAETFNWPQEELEKWNTIYTTKKDEYVEGVYFPDTYLISKNESGEDIAKRIIANFNEKFAPYMEEFYKQNIRWTTGLKIASIIQREGGGAYDMPTISGILWKRLELGMKLEMDATVQYSRGKIKGGWWAPPTGADIRRIDSPYNTYKYAGLPPHPIANPGIIAIEAVLNPVETDCIFYLHDRDKQIHCAETYEEHVLNIEKYLNQ